MRYVGLQSMALARLVSKPRARRLRGQEWAPCRRLSRPAREFSYVGQLVNGLERESRPRWSGSGGAHTGVGGARSVGRGGAGAGGRLCFGGGGEEGEGLLTEQRRGGGAGGGFVALTELGQALFGGEDGVVELLPRSRASCRRCYLER
jgi:hypothetical protein